MALSYLMNHLLTRRARQIALRTIPHLASAGRLIDIGCGTGHNAQALRQRCPTLKIVEADVVSMKMVGPPAVLFDGKRLPFEDDGFDTGLLAFVLHYPTDPGALLREIARAVSRRLLVLQSTHDGGLSQRFLAAREAVQGRWGFQVARAIGMIGPSACPLTPTQYFARPVLESLLTRSGWTIESRHAEYWPFTALSRDLYVLKKG